MLSHSLCLLFRDFNIFSSLLKSSFLYKVLRRNYLIYKNLPAMEFHEYWEMIELIANSDKYESIGQVSILTKYTNEKLKKNII